MYECVCVLTTQFSTNCKKVKRGRMCCFLFYIYKKETYYKEVNAKRRHELVQLCICLHSQLVL